MPVQKLPEKICSFIIALLLIGLTERLYHLLIVGTPRVEVKISITYLPLCCLHPKLLDLQVFNPCLLIRHLYCLRSVSSCDYTLVPSRNFSFNLFECLYFMQLQISRKSTCANDNLFCKSPFHIKMIEFHEMLFVADFSANQTGAPNWNNKNHNIWQPIKYPLWLLYHIFGWDIFSWVLLP